MTMKAILAIDAATQLGWAASIAGTMTSGSVAFPVKGNEQRGWRFVRFNHWLYKTWQAHDKCEFPLDMVVYEKPIPFHASQLASELAFGFATRIQEFCARENIPCEAVNVATLKKFATGNGHADKDAMIRMARQIKRAPVVDSNEADAICLLEYALGHFAERKKSASAGNGEE